LKVDGVFAEVTQCRQSVPKAGCSDAEGAASSR